MKRFQSHLLTFLILLLFSSLLFLGCKGKNNDATIQSAINNQTATDPSLAGISAMVADGEVTLMGNCADEDCRKNAERSIKNIDGVDKVVNNIMVADVSITPDNELRRAVEDVVKKYDGVEATVNSGVITLRGQTDRKELQQLMINLTSLRPKRIDNQLVVE